MPSTPPSRLDRTGRPLLIILGLLLFSLLSGQALLVPRVSQAQGEIAAAKENEDLTAPVVIRQLSLQTRDLVYDPVTSAHLRKRSQRRR